MIGRRVVCSLGVEHRLSARARRGCGPLLIPLLSLENVHRLPFLRHSEILSRNFLDGEGRFVECSELLSEALILCLELSDLFLELLIASSGSIELRDTLFTEYERDEKHNGQYGRHKQDDS